MRRTIDSIQVLRALAAVLVMLFHTTVEFRERMGTALWGGLFRHGEAGVDLFFVISGFVIYATVPTGPHGRAEFIRKRVVRIYPMYWLSLVPLVMFQAFNPRPNVELSLGKLLTLFALVPTWQSVRILSITWTLAIEVTFYALVAVTYFSSKRLFFVVLALWGLVSAILSNTAFLPHASIPLCLHSITLEFSYGVIAAALLRKGIQSAAPLSLALGGALFLVGLSGVLWTGHRELVRHVDFGIPAALIVYGAAAISRRLPRALVLVGDASYVLYLIHLSLISNLMKLLNRAGFGAWLAHPPTQVAVFAVVVATSCALHVWVEKPVTRRVGAWALRFETSLGGRWQGALTSIADRRSLAEMPASRS